MTTSLTEFLQSERREFEEKGANIEHNRWSKWQKYLHSLCTKNTDGSLTIPVDKVAHWERQILTSYEDLSEKEKESDRIEVRAYFPLLSSHDTQLLAFVKEMVEKLPRMDIYDDGEVEVEVDDGAYVRFADISSLFTPTKE